MRYIGLDLALNTDHSAAVMKPTGVARFSILLLLAVLLFGCSSASRSATPSPTSTDSSEPTLGPAAVPSSDDSTAAPSVTVPSTPQKQVSAVASDVLNIRAGPGLTYAVKGQLKQGDAITIIGKSADGLWWQFSGGWVSATYVQVSGDTSAVPVATPSP